MLRMLFRLWGYLWLVIVSLYLVVSWVVMLFRWITGRSTPAADLGLDDDPWVMM